MGKKYREIRSALTAEVGRSCASVARTRSGARWGRPLVWWWQARTATPSRSERSLAFGGQAAWSICDERVRSRFERAEDGGWGAYLPDLPGVVALGTTRDEVSDRIR